jgi:hypothetical protein
MQSKGDLALRGHLAAIPTSLQMTGRSPGSSLRNNRFPNDWVMTQEQTSDSTLQTMSLALAADQRQYVGKKAEDRCVGRGLTKACSGRAISMSLMEGLSLTAVRAHR